MTSNLNDDQPEYPRPPDDHVRRVYADLAVVLSNVERNSEDRQAVSMEMVVERLKTAGHAAPAIEWALHLGVTVEQTALASKGI